MGVIGALIILLSMFVVGLFYYVMLCLKRMILLEVNKIRI